MKIFIFCLSLFFSLNAFCQNSDVKFKKIEIGSELEMYPVGYILTVTSTIFIKRDWALRFRLGGNFANRKDYSGLNDVEIAKGFGASAGIVKYFPIWKGNFITGFTTDFWKIKTEWQDGNQSGITKNLVIQPWINVGYLYSITSKINTGISLGFGREINTFNKGKEVGQGWIGTTTLSLNYSISKKTKTVK